MLRAVALVAIVISIVTALTQLASPAIGAEFGTKDEAIAMVKRVQEKVKKYGVDPTFKTVTAKVREFHDRDLYPFIYTLNGVNVAHGAKPELVGKNLIDFQDQNGKYLIREMVDVARGPGHGWVDYAWTNPTTNAVEDKSAYVERMGDYFVGVGVYQTEQINDNTVTIISGSASSDDTYLRIASDLAAVLNDGNRLRILPMAGIGGAQNIRDVRFLRGIDIGLTQTSVLNNFRRSNEQLGNHDYDDKILYIAKLFNEEAHVVVRSDITSLQQLQGRAVGLDLVGSGTNTSMRDIFKRLGIKVEEVNVTQDDALEKLKKGEIDAAILIAGKPTRSMANLQSRDGLSFLSIPYSPPLRDDYLPASLSYDDYPNMIPPGKFVDTIAVGAVLIAYNWPKNTERYRRVEKFVAAFFPRIVDFQKPPRHVKWREVNLAATLAGWKRFEAAQSWLDTPRGLATTDNERQEFDQFLASRSARAGQPAGGTAQQHDQLFQEFLRWHRSRGGR